MKILSPDYYSSFSCIADKCRHNCCIGWEIDIDERTAEYYKNIGGILGSRLKNSISEQENGACFRLTEDERCPFLNSHGLCDIILELGEGALCQICTDHPRFRNYFSDHVEIGLGLCCEAAADLILTKKEREGSVVLCDDGSRENPLSEEEVSLLSLRQKLTEIAQNRDLSVFDRLQTILKYMDIDSEPIGFFADQMLSLEQMNPSWTSKLQTLRIFESETPDITGQVIQTLETFPLHFEQYLVYLLYRHLPSAFNTHAEKDYVVFITASVCLSAKLYASLIDQSAYPNEGLLIDIIREWSAEIEYSDENIEKLLNL